MNLNSPSLAQCMSLLVATPPDSNLAKLFRFCLATQVDQDSVELARNLVQKFINDPHSLAYWTFEAMASDSRFTPEEWEALSQLDNRSTGNYSGGDEVSRVSARRSLVRTVSKGSSLLGNPRPRVGFLPPCRPSW